jgi:hypothetical protein
MISIRWRRVRSYKDIGFFVSKELSLKIVAPRVLTDICPLFLDRSHRCEKIIGR